MNRNKLIVLTILLCPSLIISGQSIGIGTTTPNASSLLELSSINKGILVPRVNLTGTTDITTIPTPANALLVYNTNNALPYGRGFFYWNTATNEWIRLIASNNLNTIGLWSQSGNAGTDPALHFIGTTDNRPLVFKTNNILSGRIDPGTNCVFLGQSNGIAQTTGGNNTFIGDIAGAANTTGNDNVFLGHFAGNANTTGNANTFIGQDAGRNNRTGLANVYIGEDAGISNEISNENVFIGNGAGRNKLSSRNIAIGFNALAGGSDATQYNIAIGHGAGFSAGTGYNLPPGGGIYIGTGAGYNATNGIAIGDSSCRNCNTLEFAPNLSIGSFALYRSTSGSKNTALGSNVLRENSNGESNAVVGFDAMRFNTTGDYNTALGYRAGYENTEGDFITSIGAGAGPTTSSLSNSSAIGYNASVSTSNTMSFGDGIVDRWAFGISTTNANHALEVGETPGDGNGAYLSEGGNWVNTCDINKKENFTIIDKPDLLEKISRLSIKRWKYIGTNEFHIGPTAQEFYQFFGLGVDDKGISTVDPAGISLAAIQELIKENNELKLRIEKLEAMFETVKK